MSRRPITAEDLWRLPRVGAPEPTPDGASLIVPVTTHAIETNEGTTRLWRIPADADEAGKGGRSDPARPLTTADASSGQVAVSPDGSRMAFVRKPGGKAKGNGKGSGPEHPDSAQIYIMALDGGEPERATDLPLGASGPRWFPDGNRIAFVTPLFREAMTVSGTAEVKKARDDDPVKAAVTEDRVYRIWDSWITDEKVYHIFVLDLDTGHLTDITPSLKRWMDPSDPGYRVAIAPDGRQIAFTALRTLPPYHNFQEGVFTLPVPRTLQPGRHASRISTLWTAEASNTWRPVYSPDGRYIIYGMQRERDFYADRTRLVAYDRRTHRHHVLTEEWDRSASGWSFGDDTDTLYFAAETHARTAFYSLSLPAAIKQPDGKPPRELIRGGTFTAPRVAGKRIFANVSSLTTPPEVMSCNLRGGDEYRVTGFTKPIMNTLQMGAVDEFIFDGAEGDPVQMFVVYPPGAKMPAAGKKAKPRPLVQLVHGGPHGTFGDTWHWRWNVQVFTSPGYVGALVNFHGSTSWGQDFTASIHGRWGDQPYEDVMRATDLLVERGIADPKRLAAAGGSYGGYLVSWIASQTDRFAAIINHAGVCDLQTQFASDFTQGRQRSIGGEPWDRIEKMDRWSPMRYAAGFESPMLVLHGEKDYRVPYVQGLQIYNVYKARKLPARLVCYPDENHWILKPRNSLHWYAEVMDWLDRWIGKGSRRRTRQKAGPARRSPAKAGR